MTRFKTRLPSLRLQRLITDGGIEAPNYSSIRQASPSEVASGAAAPLQPHDVETPTEKPFLVSLLSKIIRVSYIVTFLSMMVSRAGNAPLFPPFKMFCDSFRLPLTQDACSARMLFHFFAGPSAAEIESVRKESFCLN